MPQLLTRKKDKWAAQFKPKFLRGGILNPNVSDAIKYQDKLNKLIKKMTEDVEKQLKKLFHIEAAQEFFAQDESISSQARILTNALLRKYNDLFSTLAKPLAEKVIKEADKSSSAALHGSLKELSGGLSLNTTSIADIGDILNASVIENVALIKSIPAQYLNGVQQAVMRSITSGQGLADLVPYLQKHKDITTRRARMIAHDQTRKAYNNINKGRMEKLGIKEFEWLHTGGSSHPRKKHIELNGKIFSLANPPIIDDNTGEHGIPGQLPNCRCRMVPVIKFDE